MKAILKKNCKNISLKLVLVLLSLVISSNVQAQTVADSPCDVNYYESLKSRAWLEAQREITQNQNLIFKPDSVLEYTCFDQYLNVLAAGASTMFSETTRWGEVLPDTSMDDALQNLVGTPVASYINSNFETPGYDLLGGRAGTDPGNGNAPPMIPLNPELDHNIGAVESGAYACDIMNRVWEQAKCMDFMQVPSEDGFFTFASYATDQDKRFLPSRCLGPAALWQENIDKSSVEEQTPWEEDNVVSYFASFLGESCEHTVVTNPATGLQTSVPTLPIETGIIVKRLQAPSTYVEKICLSPGCYYEPTGEETGSCKKSSNLY